MVRSVNWLGDAVMTTPALHRLRERFPNAQIDLLTPAKLADLWTGHPDLNGVVVFQKEEGLLQVARRLRGTGYDLAVLFPNSHRVALEAWLARIPRRLGIRRAGRNLLLTDVVQPPAGLVAMRKRTPAWPAAKTAAEAVSVTLPLAALADIVVAAAAKR